MREVNLALVSKLGWKLHTRSESMWATQLSCKYLNSGSFLFPPPLSYVSWLWKGILRSRNIIAQGSCHKVHPHSSLPIWTSPWIPSLSSFIPSPAPNSYPPPNLVVSNLITPSAAWNLPLLSTLFDPSSVREIQKTKIHSSPAIDTWTPAINGIFSTKSAYKLIKSLNPPLLSSPLNPKQWCLLWKINLNARLKLLLWKIAWDILPTKSKLNTIFPISAADSLCPLCKSEEDSFPHLFFRCCFARIAWRISLWPLDSTAWSSLSPSDWIKGLISPHVSFGIPKKDIHLFQIYAVGLCDLLWFSRNKAFHDGIIPNISLLASSIKKTALAHFAAWSSKASNIVEVWSPPAKGSFKINFDTAIKGNFSAQAAVCRDSNGKIIKAISQISPPCDPNFGEALAALLAASLAVSLQLKKIIIEGDSQTVITALQHPTITQDWSIDSIISDSLSILSTSSNWEARKINRSANFYAHHVAHWAAARDFSGCIPTYFPHSLSIPICSGKDPPPPPISCSLSSFGL
jgi:hypothetical protein